MATTKELVGELIDVNQQIESLEQGTDIAEIWSNNRNHGGYDRI